MSKKTRPRRKQPEAQRRSTAGKSAAAVMLVALAASVAMVSRWGSLRATLGLSTATSPTQEATPAPLSLAKEYIYAGGRLVATEEPTARTSECCVDKGSRIKSCRCYNPKLPKPQSLAATPESLTQVVVAWAPAGEGLRYELERSTSVNGPFTPVSLDTPTSVTNGTDGTCTAYLYRVRSVDEFGDYSDYSNVDIATTCAFSQDPLVPRSTAIRAAHLEELRLAVEAVRRMAALPEPPPPWTDGALSGKRIRAMHVEELRSRLDEALARLSLPPPPPYTDAQLLGLPVKATHIQELRDRMK